MGGVRRTAFVADFGRRFQQGMTGIIGLPRTNSGVRCSSCPEANLRNPLAVACSSMPTQQVGSCMLGVQRVVICPLIVSATKLSAQSASTGALTGTVTDTTGAVLQSARITMRNAGTDEARTAITEEDGRYRFSRI